MKADQDDLDDYSPSDSEEEYTVNEKNLLKKVRNRAQERSDSEDEVYAVRSEHSDSDQSDLALSDIEGQEDDDDFPDVRAWGKDKRQFYKTDYVDQDYGGFQGKDAHFAELEEEEAKNLQKQLAQQLDDADFALDLFAKKPVEEEKATEEIVKTDISKLSKRQKLQILEKESPEFFSLIEDFKAKMAIAKEYLHPLLQKHKSGDIAKCPAVDFVQTQYETVLNYCMNIYMYLYLKSTKTNVQNHPVIKRLFQYRQLLLQLEPVFEEVIKPQIEILLSEIQTSDDNKKTRRKKTLKFLAALSCDSDKLNKKRKKVAVEEEESVKPSKKTKEDTKAAEVAFEGKIDGDPSDNEEAEQEKQRTELSKRAITYEMAKNKGLTPHRKKEQRNPRVKHRVKYRKAVIRRKGAVREPRKELTRYGGEISGIKANVSKSIKIKS